MTFGYIVVDSLGIMDSMGFGFLEQKLYNRKYGLVFSFFLLHRWLEPPCLDFP